jgi:hypothetical protein
MAEHYGRIVNEEQGKIDQIRDPKDKIPQMSDDKDDDDDEDSFPDFMKIVASGR